jgi:NPCBM/NEW2 domain
MKGSKHAPDAVSLCSEPATEATCCGADLAGRARGEYLMSSELSGRERGRPSFIRGTVAGILFFLLVIFLAPIPQVAAAADPQGPEAGSPALDGPRFVYPENGQTLDYEGAYVFKVKPVPGASKYLWGFFQGGKMVWENYADERKLSGTEYSIQPGTSAHKRFVEGDVDVWVRGLVNGDWTDATIITIRLQPGAASPGQEAASPGPEANGVVSYVDDYAQECSAASLTARGASINGSDYAHTVLQWAGDTRDPVTIKRKAYRFQATIGVRDDASDQVRVQFELLGDNGKQLFQSRVLGYGDSQKVDVSVEGVLRITLRATAASSTHGYAGWGDARLTAPTKLEC